MDALREVEPGGHFLGAAHTQRNFETALWRPTIWDTTTYEQWTEEGALDAAQRANAMWKRCLAEYEAPLLDPALGEALEEYRNRRVAEIRAAS